MEDHPVNPDSSSTSMMEDGIVPNDPSEQGLQDDIQGPPRAIEEVPTSSIGEETIPPHHEHHMGTRLLNDAHPPNHVVVHTGDPDLGHSPPPPQEGIIRRVTDKIRKIFKRIKECMPFEVICPFLNVVAELFYLALVNNFNVRKGNLILTVVGGCGLLAIMSFLSTCKGYYEAATAENCKMMDWIPIFRYINGHYFMNYQRFLSFLMTLYGVGLFTNDFIEQLLGKEADDVVTGLPLLIACAETVHEFVSRKYINYYIYVRCAHYTKDYGMVVQRVGDRTHLTACINCCLPAQPRRRTYEYPQEPFFQSQESQDDVRAQFLVLNAEEA